MNERKFFGARAKSLIKDLREQKGVQYAKLAQALTEGGWSISEQVLINRVNRGTYPFAFALQLLSVLGVETLEIPNSAKEALEKSKMVGKY